MGIFDAELDSRTERKFEKYMESGGLRDLTNILLKKALIGGVFVAAISNIAFYQEGVVPFFGSFSFTSAIIFSVVMIGGLTGLMALGDFFGGAVTYLILSRKTDIEFRTVLAANVIGGAFSHNSKSHLLISKKTGLDRSEVKGAVFAGFLLFIFLSTAGASTTYVILNA